MNEINPDAQTPANTPADVPAEPLAQSQPPQYQPPQAPAAPAAPQYQAPQVPAAPQYQAPGAPQYQAPYIAGQQSYQQNTSGKTNVMAIIALIMAFLMPLVAIILGHISLGQIKKTGEGGRGLALTGTILGYVFTFFGIIFTIIFGSVYAALLSEGFYGY